MCRTERYLMEIRLLTLKLFISFLLSSAVRLAYDSIDATTDGEDLPPLVILHGLFGSKQNWRTLAKRFHRETGRQVTIILLLILFRHLCLRCCR